MALKLLIINLDSCYPCSYMQDRTDRWGDRPYFVCTHPAFHKNNESFYNFKVLHSDFCEWDYNIPDWCPLPNIEI